MDGNSQTPAFLRPKEPKSAETKRKLKAALPWVGYVVLLAIVLAGASFIGWISKSAVVSETVKQMALNTPPEQVFGTDSITLLVLGVDEDREPGGKIIPGGRKRSDMMMVVKLDFQEKRITGLSIPRDTMTIVSGYSAKRINAYHALGGTELATKAVESLLGVPIDKTVVVNFDVFQKMVDDIGGVNVNVEKRMKYTDKRGGLYIDIQKGPQKLDGYDAMCYVRYRQDSDFERQKRQKKLLLAMKETVMSKPALITNLAERTQSLTSNAFQSKEMAALIKFTKDVPSDNVQLGALPVIERSNYDLYMDPGKLAETLARYRLN